MKRETFNKRLVSFLRFIYKVGVIQSTLFLISFLAAGEEYSVKWKGRQVFLRKGTSDFHVFKQVLAFEHYKIKNLQPENVNVIIDLGANIGLSAVYFSHKYPKAMLVAIEPDKANYNQLLKNVRDIKQVNCMNNAIWKSNKTLDLIDTGKGAYSYMVKELEPGAANIAVQAITLNEVMAQFQLAKIDLMKIDIEGSEKEIFEAADTNWLTRVGCIVIELHDWLRPGCAASFFSSLYKMNYTMSFKGENVTIAFDRDHPVISLGQNMEALQESCSNNT